MKHIKGTHRSHISGKGGRRFIKSAAKRGIIDRLREEAENLDKHLKKCNFVDYHMAPSYIYHYYFTNYIF